MGLPYRRDEMTKREQIEARRLQTTIMRGRWAQYDAEVAAKRAIPQTAEEIEASRRALRAAFGLGGA